VEASGTLLVFEDLNIKNMTASAKGTAEEPVRTFAESRTQQIDPQFRLGQDQNLHQYKGLRKNKLTITIAAHYSSQECSRCGFTHKDNRSSQAEFICKPVVSCAMLISMPHL